MLALLDQGDGVVPQVLAQLNLPVGALVVFQNSTLSDRNLFKVAPVKPLATRPLFASVQDTGKQEPTRLRPIGIGTERFVFDTRPQNITFFAT